MTYQTKTGETLHAIEVIYNGDPLGYAVHVENIDAYITKLQAKTNAIISWRYWNQQ